MVEHLFLRQLSDPIKVELTQETYNWLISLSLEKSNIAEDGSTIDEKKSGSGHSYDNVNDSMGALVMMVLLILLMVTAYMAYRVYFQRKYLTESWLK
jgi:hypothetical protein